MKAQDVLVIPHPLGWAVAVTGASAACAWARRDDALEYAFALAVASDSRLIESGPARAGVARAMYGADWTACRAGLSQQPTTMTSSGNR